LFGLKDLNDLPTLKEFSALDPELAEALPLEPSD
jgi:segregation and condensation protein B